jgi:hypothetical protein
VVEEARQLLENTETPATADESRSLSIASRVLITTMIRDLDNEIIDTEDVDVLRQIIRQIMQESQAWPTIRNTNTRGRVINQLADIIKSMREGGPIEIAISGGLQAQNYLLCAGIGQMPAISLEPLSSAFVHRLTEVDGNFSIFTDTLTTTEGGNTPLWEIIADLLGISDLTSSQNLQDHLMQRDNRAVVITRTFAPSTIPTGEIQIADRDIIINPDNRLPHVWNA